MNLLIHHITQTIEISKAIFLDYLKKIPFISDILILKTISVNSSNYRENHLIIVNKITLSVNHVIPTM